MAIIITLDDIKISSWTVYADATPRRIEVLYRPLSTNEELVGEEQVALFWETMPENLDIEGNPLPQPDNWYLLPPAYVQNIIDITVAAKGALMHTVDE